MKLLNFILINIMMLGGLTVSTCNQAKAGELPAEKKVKAICTELRQKVSFPDELVNQTVKEKVDVEFKINENNTIEVTSVSGKNEYLKTYVKQQLESLSLGEYQEFVGKNLSISFWFSN